MVVTLPLVLAFLGLVLDLGILMLRSQQLDAATDAAALAAADGWERDAWVYHTQVIIDSVDAKRKAGNYLARNMPQARLVSCTVGPPTQVSVHTEVVVPHFFLRVFGYKEKRIESYSTVRLNG